MDVCSHRGAEEGTRCKFQLSQRAAVKINDRHQRGPPEGSGNPSVGASCSAAAAFAVHRQQVTVIKCFFISSQAATKGQNRIKQSGGMRALLMPRPFESALAARGSGMLRARITEQRDGEIRGAGRAPSSSRFYLHIQTASTLPAPPNQRRPHHHPQPQRTLGPGRRDVHPSGSGARWRR